MSCAPVSRCALISLASVFLTSPLVVAQSQATAVPVSAGNPTVERALASQVTLTLPDTSIQELASQLRCRFHINVMIDRRALDDVGLGGDARVPGIEWSDVVLEDALEMLLEQVELYFYVRNDILVLTTPEQAENHLDTVVYPVGDLVATIRGDVHGRFIDTLDFDTLIQTITSTVQPDTWDEVGGAGAIESYAGSRSLVISQTRSVHRDVRALLAKLRQSRAAQGFGGRAALSDTVSEAWPQRSNSAQQQPRRYVYLPDGAWSMPRQHD